MPAFFVPHIKPEKSEEAYAELAAACHCGVPGPNERVYSITFTHDGETWTATVGEQLKGNKTVTRGRGRTKSEYNVPLSNASTVMAIFPNVPYFVWHDGVSHQWANPFMAG